MIAHGTPWCTSRFSGFGLVVLAPSRTATDGHILWHTERGYSRLNFQPRLKTSGDTFEFRINADEMVFNESGFERTVVYRYRVSQVGVTRLGPVALNARGFVEEWLSMPWNEAVLQEADPDTPALQQLHKAYQHDQQSAGRQYTSWEAGSVRACTGTGRFQVAFDSQTEHFVEGKPSGEQGPATHHFFQLREFSEGYQIVSVAPTPDPTCNGADLLHKQAGAAKLR